MKIQNTFENLLQSIDGIMHIPHITPMIKAVLLFPDCRYTFNGWQIAKYLRNRWKYVISKHNASVARILSYISFGMILDARYYYHFLHMSKIYIRHLSKVHNASNKTLRKIFYMCQRIHARIIFSIWKCQARI